MSNKKGGIIDTSSWREIVPMAVCWIRYYRNYRIDGILRILALSAAIRQAMFFTGYHEIGYTSYELREAKWALIDEARGSVSLIQIVTGSDVRNSCTYYCHAFCYI